MKRATSPLILFLLLFAPACQAQEPKAPTTLPPIEVYFSPKGGCTQAVVKEINAAQSVILVQAYSFTSAPIAKALVEADQEEVQVQVILDRSQLGEKCSLADFLLHADIPVSIDAKHQIAHNTTIIIDGATVITGSFNFTKAAEENNAENLLVIRSPELAAKYTANWTAHAEHSEKYEGKERGYSETRPPDPAPAAEVSEGYVASKNSAVFHKADCKSAAKISAKNVVRYATREEAIGAGKKPCAECQP